ncbi:hypothetical protein POJ06DRAFT_107742 [Lipomyces tetrasporus]|uniref:SGTA homodimerisation domain-containing protein n=1 Tax=Lipomyces tetrasporus TaxID=54092 RepID=A0AAD7QSI7_9ASCO|nr:uncharacterized protein POJ06DRAFT_107742 [Lipomyces tetrasporus]KAJ8100590.1 hypothetical protein POJ06DRAFT_107742 [Lipomyces tetrasporus]
MSSKEDLALGIVDFLQNSLADGTVSEDDKDSVEVAIQCLTDVFKVDLSKRDAVLGAQSLLSIFQAFEKVRDARAKASAAAAEPTKPASASAGPAEADKAKAEELKSEGNKFVAAKNYPAAIESYTKALVLDPTNKIFYSNRAAAYSASGKHDMAVKDAESALEIDERYSKAYSRLGLAKFALGDAEGAMKAYEKGIEIEGNGGSDVMRRGYETAKARVEEDLQSAVPEDTESTRSAAATTDRGAGGFPDLSSLAGMFGGGTGGAGGMDFGSLMNNPQIAQMAQQFMSNPGAMQGLLNNPSIRSMAERFRSGNTPSMAEMMSDPSIADMARNFMGGNNSNDSS